MPINTYKKIFQEYFNSAEIVNQLDESVALIKKSKRLFFIGNGGSNSICSHMMEDYAKIGRFPTFSFSDAALITCYANDYGYEKAMEEWIKIHYTAGDTLIAISSSGKSANVLNAVDYVKSKNGKVITLSGFKKENLLSKKGDINFYIPVENYGIIECYHQVILHIILDKIAGTKPV